MQKPVYALGAVWVMSVLVPLIHLHVFPPTHPPAHPPPGMRMMHCRRWTGCWTWPVPRSTGTASVAWSSTPTTSWTTRWVLHLQPRLRMLHLQFVGGWGGMLSNQSLQRAGHHVGAAGTEEGLDCRLGGCKGEAATVSSLLGPLQLALPPPAPMLTHLQRPASMNETEYVSQMLTKVKRFAQVRAQGGCLRAGKKGESLGEPRSSALPRGVACVSRALSVCQEWGGLEAVAAQG